MPTVGPVVLRRLVIRAMSPGGWSMITERCTRQKEGRNDPREGVMLGVPRAGAFVLNSLFSATR